MSIQDESFPYDDLETSRNSGQHMIFPHHKPRIIKINSQDIEDEDDEEMNNNEHHSTVSSPGHHHHQNDSTESSNDGGPNESETSGKTNASEPEGTDTKKNEFARNPQSKSVSYQDIHSEYTKRRYKHVESKVGKYIANMKAQDKKRNSGKFQRHRSMPETLSVLSSGPKSLETEQGPLRNVPPKRGILRHSTNDLDQIHDEHESAISDHDTENFDNITGTTSSSSREMIQDAGIYLDRQTYEQLLSDRDRGEYLQSMMDEKKAEIWRLKQNLENMRIEYTMCKDKLRQMNQAQRMSLGGGIGGGMGLGSYGLNSVTNVSRTSLQCLLAQQETHDKATQTETMLTPSPVPSLAVPNRAEMFDTPLTPDSNNNSFDHNAVGVMAPAHLKVPKTIATIQPLSLNFSNLLEQDNSRESCNNTMGFLRQRSNSMANRQKSTPLVMAFNNSKLLGSANKSFIPNSETTGIDIEVIESPRKQRQSRREEFVYFENRSQRAINNSNGRNLAEAETTCSPGGLTTTMIVNTSAGGDSVVSGGAAARKHHNRRSLGTRVMRLFGACTKCDDPNRSMDTTMDQSQHQSYSQIPLLEKSRANRRPNLR